MTRTETNSSIININGHNFQITEFSDYSVMLTPVYSKEEMTLWARYILAKYAGEFKFVYDDNTVYALEKTGETDGLNLCGLAWGRSVCSSTDEYNIEIGQAIAIARAAQEKVPNFVIV